ncbi:DUF262 domain-containing protein [Nocardia sp. SYP-A9097]|uniref:DUF262 domain-containing protein n=1 Tax=Nocardia sp. SYP-A9097 TaxID=2663237 RepID=UPI00129BA2AD|nr:DUF262 domain-containing protein [Nocardia sp. SYP-A9097]MRH92568.1 DUF262 domain-containing protein [Nocardia sp. SYP-A9097]
MAQQHDADFQTFAMLRELGVSGELVDVERENSNGPVEPYDPNQIDVLTRTPTINLVLSRLKRGKIDLQPDFQRAAGIWNDDNQSRLIESMLLRIPLPAFYAAETQDDAWAIVDGIQRLTSIARFMAPELTPFQPLKLKGLNYLAFEGASFEDLPGHLQTRLEETEIVLHLIRLGTPDAAKFNIFARLNTGGLPLTTQELRHALIPGPARGILAELADSFEFLAATDGSVASSRMADREMVLRFIAFLLIDPKSYGEKDFDQFLRKSMQQINNLPDSEIDHIKLEFTRSMNAAQEIFGPYAFRKRYVAKSNRFPINKALFEALGVTLARRSPQQLKALITQREAVVSGFMALMSNDTRFEQSISMSTGDPARVRYRFTTLDGMLSNFDRR